MHNNLENFQSDFYPPVTIVVIGFNEAGNLEQTFTAISNIDYDLDRIELIYVDSGSSDNSVEIARRYTQKIFIEDRYPSPGRNRNRGLLEANNEIVHFIDGDVMIDRDYLKSAVELISVKGVQAVVGRLEEQDPNIFNRLSAISNHAPKQGYTLFTATGATYLRSALLYVQGYDERLRRGEEIELGERFNGSGYQIWYTVHRMGSHNFGVYGLWSYLKKYKQNAVALVQAAFLSGESDFFIRAKKSYRVQMSKLILIVIALLLTVFLPETWPFFIAFYMAIVLYSGRRYLPLINSSALIPLELLISVLGQGVSIYWLAHESVSKHFMRDKQLYYKLRKETLWP